MKRRDAQRGLVVVCTRSPDWGLCEIIDVGNVATIQEVLRDKVIRHYSSYGQLKVVEAKNSEAIPLIDCPVCGVEDAPLSFKATMVKGDKSVDIYECVYCGKVPNLAEDVEIKGYVNLGGRLRPI